MFHRSFCQHPNREFGFAASSTHTDLSYEVYAEGERCIVRATGDLDLASRAQLMAAVTSGNSPMTVIDLAAVTFMDCSGYGSIVASEVVLAGQHRTLSLRGSTGQPARLLKWIAGLEATTSG